jgi:uncharacterized phage protein (TIGR01671 family)
MDTPRVIKFRGKTPSYGEEGGKWIYGNLFTIGIDEKNLVGHAIVPFNHEYKDGSLHELMVVGKTVGQFTGMHDANGKEIYEDDIVKVVIPINAFTQEVWRYRKVVYSGRGFEFVDKNNTPICDVVGASGSPKYYVIGNVHDDLELLNQEETRHDH